MKYIIGVAVTAMAIAAACAFIQPELFAGARAKTGKQGNQPGVAQGQAAASAPSAVQQQISTFQASREWNKLDATLQTAWVNAMNSDPTTRMDLFVRVQPPADMGDEAFLNSSGFNVRMFSGPVASGNLAAKDLPQVAQQPFVVSLRLATK